MRIAVSADERVGVAGAVAARPRERGHDVILHGALAGTPSADADDQANVAHVDELV
jgi:ribose 5-phosphate isomerase B